MNRDKPHIFIYLTLGLLLFSTEIFAQEIMGSFRERGNIDIVSETVIETDSSSYVREREVILRQLEIITGDEETRYIIVPGDTLTVSFQDRSRTNEAVYQVSGSGEIYIPLAGAVKVAGLNRQQTRVKISDALAEYIRYPKVELFVNVEGRYMVAGEVGQPGVFRIRSNLSMMEAIIGADYDKEAGRINSIILVRGSYDNPIVTRLDLLKMIRQGDRSDNIMVKPGDFIYVPKSLIGNIEKFIDTVYRYVSAYYGFGRIPGEPADKGAEPDKVFWE